MDLLIHLIIWIFRTLFGEQEPPAKLGPRDASDEPDDRRGPYNYGDGRSNSGSPKTLAELLEEARRQSGQGRSGGAQPQVRQAEPRPEPRVEPRLEPRPQTRVIVPQVPVQLPGLQAAQAVQPQGKKGKRRREAAQANVEMPAQPMAMPMAAPGPRRVGLNTGPQTLRARQLMPLFAALKQGKKSNPAVLGAQAMVLKEVFGPPRALEPFRGGRR